jgi:hypothetical protein
MRGSAVAAAEAEAKLAENSRLGLLQRIVEHALKKKRGRGKIVHLQNPRFKIRHEKSRLKFVISNFAICLLLIADFPYVCMKRQRNVLHVLKPVIFKYYILFLSVLEGK